MRKIRIFALILLIMGAFFAVSYLLAIPLGEPRLKVEFYPNPPWNVMSGETLNLSVSIVNNAWLFAIAKNVHVILLAPESFIVYETGTNEYNLSLNMLRGGERRNNILTLTVPPIVSSISYNMTIRLLAENAPEQILTAEIRVNQTIYIP